EARTYASWQPAGARSAVRSAAATVEELRAEGVYRVLTPDDCAALGRDTYVLHPLVGGMPVDAGWRSLPLFAERVLPRLDAWPVRAGAGRVAAPARGPGAGRGWGVGGGAAGSEPFPRPWGAGRGAAGAGVSPSPPAACPSSP